MSSLFTHIPHPWTQERKSVTPAKAADQLPAGNAATRFNSALAIKITNGVGTMWCAYAFAVLALVSLPDAIRAGRPAIISWIAQTFLQLVLLSIIIVGQNILSAAADQRSEATYKDADAVLHEANEIERHLESQDQAIERILAMVEHLKGGGPEPATPTPSA